MMTGKVKKQNDKVSTSPHRSTHYFDRTVVTEDVKSIIDEVEYVYNAAPCGYCSLNADGDFVRINDTALRWWGYERAELLNKKNFKDIISEKSRQKFVKEFELLKKEGKIENVQREIVCKNGSLMYVLMNSVALYDETGAFEMNRAVITNISEQKLLVEELEDLYDNAPCGYYTVDTNGIVTRMNKTALSWLGYTKVEIEGKFRGFDFISIPIEEQEAYRKIFYEQINSGGIYKNLELSFKRKNGTRFPVSFHANAVKDNNNETVMSRVSFWDITEKKQLETELRKTSEQLYAANVEKDKFIGLASHDLQNPITAIQMCTELLQKSGSNLTSMQLKLIQNMRSSAERANYIVTNILNLNKIDTGVISDEWRTISLKSLMWDTSNRFQSFAGKKSITFKHDFDEKEDWNFLTEPNYLTQAFENLVSNAIKFSRNSKCVTIELKKNKKQFFISVIDEGQGIKQEEMHLLFGKFQKLSAQPTGGEISTGLGLSIAKEYIELLSGKIICESEWGVGSKFTIVLPQNTFEK